MATIGKAIKIKGDVVGGEDTVIEGRVEGRVVFKDHHLTIGANGDVHGEVNAKRITVVGTILGDVVASDRIDVQNSGVIEGDLSAPNLLVVEGGRHQRHDHDAGEAEPRPGQGTRGRTGPRALPQPLAPCRVRGSWGRSSSPLRTRRGGRCWRRRRSGAPGRSGGCWPRRSWSTCRL